MRNEITDHLYLQEVTAYGVDNHRGNLVGIQPFMLPADYASERRFHAKINGYLNVALQRGWLDEKTIVALPEYIGAWLVAAEEKQCVYEAKDIESAMKTLVQSNLFAFARVFPFAFTRSRDKVTFTLFRIKAARMAEIYHNVFSELAKKYRVTIVAGSILLPSPQVHNGKLVIGNGALYNVSVVYKPDGTACADVVRKVFPIKAELPFVARGLAADLPVFDTPAGRLGVLICADSWHPCTCQVMKANQADFIIVPSYLSPDGVWEKPWLGYDGAPAPADVDARDVNRITEGEAWLKYALAGRMASAGASQGINVFLRGRLWDLGSAGHTIVVREETVVKAKHVDGAAIINSWL